ncbi:hypothetical protein [Intestinimonas butyriciproducens]|uniref:hypothetical protein n=1 Tax=Intestinimonas butyriciproducens TaxID=1297617 RepID=UPI003119ACE2
MEPNTGFIYKMLANPRGDTPNTRFFLQAYAPLENGKLSPGDVLFLGTKEKCGELLGRLTFGELTQEQVRNYYIHGKEPTVRYYRINEEAARQAKERNSFSDYTPGAATASYRRMVDKAVAIAEQQKARVDPMYHDKIDYLVDLYARKLADNLNQGYGIDARMPSYLIAGGGNFSGRKKQKQNAASDKNVGEYLYIQGLLDKIRSTGTGGISADDRQAMEKLEVKLESLKTDQEHMKAVNTYYRKHKTLEGCPVLTPEGIAALQASMARDWRKDSVPYPSFHLSNNNANIRRIEQRIHDLKNRPEFVGWDFPGGRAEVNEDENRLQLFFDEKPGDEQRQALSHSGFHWSRRFGAWQRQLNRNAIYAADRIDFIRPEGGGSISALQPYNQKLWEAPDVGGDR